MFDSASARVLLYLWLFNRIVRWQPDRPASRVYIGQIEPCGVYYYYSHPQLRGGNGFHDIFHYPMLHWYVVQEDLVCYVLTRKRLTNPFFFLEGISFFHFGRMWGTRAWPISLRYIPAQLTGDTTRTQKIKRSIWGVRQTAHTGGGGTPKISYTFSPSRLLSFRWYRSNAPERTCNIFSHVNHVDYTVLFSCLALFYRCTSSTRRRWKNWNLRHDDLWSWNIGNDLIGPRLVVVILKIISQHNL